MQSKASNLLSVASLLISLFGASTSPTIAIGAPVNTTSGLTIGHADPLYPAVSEYLGIPFARPPVADLRFAPPQAYSSNKRVVADKQPLSCQQSPAVRNTSEPQPEQNINADAASFANNTSEDCLYLNVWTKPPGSCSEKKPVLVWFYGGGFHGGGASDDAEQGGIFADEQDVVMVNFNYRLGIFGFSGAPGLTHNAGLLDQRLALEWVRDNIEAFGGDPSRITIVGHSAGAASVDYYTYAWLEDPIVAGVIPMSGSATSFGHRLASTGKAAWEGTSQLLGCGNSSTVSESAMLKCMRQKSERDLFEASLEAGDQVKATRPKEDSIYIGVTGIYAPTIDNKIIFDNYTTLGDQGKFIKVPIMTGNNIDEACIFAQRGTFPVKADPFITEVIFTCPAHHAAKFRASAGVPAWKYSWISGYPNLLFQKCPGKPWHGSEMRVMFGSTVISSQGYPATEKENSDGFYLRKAVASFASNPKSALKTEMHWPEFGSDENQIVELATNETVMTVGNSAKTSAICNKLFRYGGPSY